MPLWGGQIPRVRALLSCLLIAVCSPAPAEDGKKPDTVVEPHEVRPLPGGLDQELMFNSNSPEQVLSEGILLSTFPSRGKKTPEAHLNYELSGTFSVFAHHVAKGNADDLRTLYLAILVGNPSQAKKVQIQAVSGASYLSQPDAPFITLDAITPNDDGSVFAGPGDRVMNSVLQDKLEIDDLRKPQTILPGETRVLLSLPIPVKDLTPPLNGRSLLVRLRSSGPVHMASLAMFAQPSERGESAPSPEDWLNLLSNGSLATPRDKAPTPPGAAGPIAYGRVAGVAAGSTWSATITDASSSTNPPQAALAESESRQRRNPSSRHLTIPLPGSPYSYVLSTVEKGTFGTGQIQSAPLVVRYPDTAYQAHGNYAVRYHLKLPLFNNTASIRTVSLAIQSPLKKETGSQSLSFLEPPPARVFFRGTVRVRYKDDEGKPEQLFHHLVLNQGQRGQGLATLRMEPFATRVIDIDWLYPPDSTPPQVLTIETSAP